jgi:putative ABC transport system permease protein
MISSKSFISRRKTKQPSVIEHTRLTLRDLWRESLAGLSQRPSRTILTTVGTVLGIGAFVTVMGLTATASGQISSTFSQLKDTEVTVSDAGATPSSDTVYSFPKDADTVVDSLHGVVAAGQTWPIPGSPVFVSGSPSSTDADVELNVSAASPGYLKAIDSTISSGIAFNAFHESEALHVAVLGAGAARELGIRSASSEPLVTIDGTQYTIVGILSNAQRDAGALATVFIPATTAIAVYGEPESLTPATMLIETKVGAAPLVASQVPDALRPDQPQLLQAVPPQNLFSLENSVTGSLTELFLILAAVTLIIGAVGIANTTLVAVIERTPEIGLRRAIGARPRHIAAQILSETAVIGTLGGLVGTTLGIVTVLIVSIVQSWTALLNPWLTVTAPFIGTAIGILAGIYPARRAAHVEPIEALKR